MTAEGEDGKVAETGAPIKLCHVVLAAHNFCVCGFQTAIMGLNEYYVEVKPGSY